MPTFSRLTGLLLSSASLLSLAGCALEGVRATSGECPAGETCSSETPNGLSFTGASLADGLFGTSGVTTVAVGGTETVTAFAGGASIPAFSVTADGFALVVADVTAPSFEVRGVSSGTSLVQLFQFGTSSLLDEVDLEAEVISSVSLVPQDTVLLLAEAVADQPGSTSPPASFAMLAGSAAPIPLVVRLHGTTTDRLVDEGITAATPQGPVSKKAWDVLDVAAPSTAGQVMFSVQAGAGSFSAVVPVVDVIDSISPFTLNDPLSPIQVVSAGSTTVCFTAGSGGALVAGATWAFASSTNVAVTPTSPSPSCVSVEGKSAGAATLTATASGFSQTFGIQVVAASHQRAPSVPRRDDLRGIVQPTPGHRAEWAAAR